MCKRGAEKGDKKLGFASLDENAPSENWLKNLLQNTIFD